MAVAKAAAEESGLPLYRYFGGAGRDADAGADDERDQRRRARQQQPRHPGVHDRAGRARSRSARRCAAARRFFNALKKIIDSKGMSTAVGDEGGFAPNLPNARRGDRADPRGGRTRPATRPGRTWCSRSTARLRSSTRTASTCSNPRDQTLGSAGVRRLPGRARRHVSDRVDRGRHGGERLGGLEAAHRRGWAAKLQLVGDDLFVTNTQHPARRHRARAWRTRS